LLRIQLTDDATPALGEWAAVPNVATLVVAVVEACTEPLHAVAGLGTEQLYFRVSVPVGGLATEGVFPVPLLKSVVTCSTMLPVPPDSLVRMK
jgi:hypothetical protein